METSHFKKALSLFLAVIMLFSVMPAAVFATQESLPVMKVFNVSSVDDFHATAYCGKVYSVTFLDRIDTDSISASDTVASWDISHAGDGSVMAWAKINDIETTAAGADRYDIYIGGEGGVQAHEDTTYMFYAFQKLEVVNGLENLHTGKVKSFKDWFSLCSSLESIDLSALDTSSATSFKNLFFNCRKLQYANLHGWNTENVTDMSYMFYNCVALKEVDLRSFDTSKVTTMYFMFYRAGELTDIYIGSGWTNESIANLNESVFNCCYAIRGGKFNIYNDVEFIGKWEKKVNYYKVTYRYKGDVPVNAPALPAEKSYEEGSEVTVAPAPSFIGYEFSGWSTQDADITNGKFGIYKDVVIVGRWTMKPGAVTSIVVPDDFTIVLGEEAKLEAYVNGSAYNQKLIYSSDNESVIKVDADGNITTVGAGTAKVKISSAANPDIYGIVTITVTADPAFNTNTILFSAEPSTLVGIMYHLTAARPSSPYTATHT